MVDERTLEYSVLLTLFGLALMSLLGLAGLTDNAWLYTVLRLGSF
jgi:hypothetical protein